MAYGKSSGGMGSQYGRGNRLAAALAPDAAAIGNIKGNTQGLAYALQKGLQGLFAGMDAKDQRMFQTGFAEAMRPDPTTTIDMGTGDESEIDGAIDTVELTNSPEYNDELKFNEDQEVIGEAEVMGAGPALSESELRGSGVAASSPMAIPGRNISTRLTDFLSSPAMAGNRYAGDMAIPMAMQQMSQERKLQAAQKQRQQELADMVTKQRDRVALKASPGAMSGSRPSSPIQNFARLQELQIQYPPGPDGQPSPQVRQFAEFVRASKLLNLGDRQVITSPLNPAAPTATYNNQLKPGEEPSVRRAQASASAVGKAVGGEHGTALASLSQAQAHMPALESVVADLKKLAKTSSYTFSDKTADAVRRELGQNPTQGAIDRVSYVAHVRNAVLPLLRQTFGAAFTVEEGKLLLTTLGDPNQSPLEREAALDAFIEDKTRQLGVLQRQVEQYSGPYGASPSRQRLQPGVGNPAAKAAMKKKYGLQ